MKSYVSDWPFIDTVRFLFWGTVLGVVVLCFADPTLRAIIKSRGRILLCALVLALIWRVPPDGRFYHGLEYEDSYVYTVAARQMLENTPGQRAPIGFPASISTCAAGSLRTCRDWETYPEHLVGTAYLISAYSRIFGYTPDVASWVAICAAFVSCCLIVLTVGLLSNDRVAAASAAFLFAMTPIFAVQGLETSAEPVSNAAISIVAFLLVYVLRHGSSLASRHLVLVLLSLTLSIGCAMTIKRENAFLLIAVPALLLALDPNRSAAWRVRKTYLIGICSIVVVCGVFAWYLNIPHTGEGELSLVVQFAPTVNAVYSIVFAFVRSLLVPKWYFGGALFVAWGMIASRHEKPSLAVTLLFLGYLALYALHIRGYYELRSGNSDPRAALRFEMSLMSLWSLLGGIGVAAIVRRFPVLYRRGWRAFAVGCVALGLCTLSYATTRSFRVDGVEDEQEVRLAPAKAAAQLASASGDYIITFEPLVLQMYGTPETKVLDTSVVSESECSNLGLFQGTTPAILVDEEIHHSSADADRYSEQLSFLAHWKREQIYRGDGFRLYRVSFGSSGDGTVAGFSASQHLHRSK